MGTDNCSVTSNNIKLVHWPLMGGLLRLVQRGGDRRGLAYRRRRRRGGYVIVLSVIRSFCLSVNRITDERGNGRRVVDQTWQTWARRDLLEVINFWWLSGSACGFRITFAFSSPLRNRGFLDICQHFSYNQPTICTILGEMTDADKITHPQHFWDRSDRHPDPVNPKIWIRIPHHFQLNFGVG